MVLKLEEVDLATVEVKKYRLARELEQSDLEELKAQLSQDHPDKDGDGTDKTPVQLQEDKIASQE